jgi:hypothetical protein
MIWVLSFGAFVITAGFVLLFNYGAHKSDLY